MVKEESTLQGISFQDIAQHSGTPAYVYDAEKLATSYAQARDVLGDKATIYYSLKANPHPAIVRELTDLGARTEVSSLAELTTVLELGISPSHILFLGPGKKMIEIGKCLETGVRIIAESWQELDVINALASEVGIIHPVILRVNPSFKTKGTGLTMGGTARQFGIDEVQLIEDVARLRAYDSLRFVGYQAYMGTRFLDAESIIENTRHIIHMARKLQSVHGFLIETLDVGGGWGVAYFENETDLDLRALKAGMRPLLEEFQHENSRTELAVELGRFLVAPSGHFLTRVLYTKESYGENFAIADGGTNGHMAAVGIGSFVKRNFPMTLVSPHEGRQLESWNVSGPLCTPNDLIAKKCTMPSLRPGDLITVDRSGAYGPSASPGRFLSHGYPAEVLVKDGRALVISEHEDLSDITSRYQLLDSHQR